jgi:hypothetical protein
MPQDPEFKAHLEWLGYLQPVGLVVSPYALCAAQAQVDRNIIPDHKKFLECIEEVIPPGGDEPVPSIQNLPRFFEHVLGWERADLIPAPESLDVALTDYDEVLKPTLVVKDPDAPPDAPNPYLMLIQVLPIGAELDAHEDDGGGSWHASPQAKFERLLKENKVPIGLLINRTHLRLCYAPSGETSGHLTFPVKAMTEVTGRPIFAALHMLLSADRLFTLEPKRRLPAIMSESRKYQNVVSTKLAGQVLSALYELLRGFQAADERKNGELLKEVLAENPDQVYAGLLTVLLRMVFVLYTEDRGLLPRDALYQNHYSVSGLFEQLRADANQHPDTMDQRYGAWARLVTLSRMLYDGASHGSFRIPARHGHLFDPERFPFLEGRKPGQKAGPGERIQPPLVSDGVVYRVLDNLLILDGERLSYRTLDVEQIGSIYEAMMGFRLEVSEGRSIAIKAKKTHGAPTTINLEELLRQSPEKRAKWFQDLTGQDVTGNALKAFKEATTPEAAVEALGRKVALEATPNIVPAGSMVLQPSEERRRSGSHYTPRSLTEPIVRTTLRPILERLGENPTPEQILVLKVCDIAVGSGAFLVEADRQLGDALVKAWYAHKCMPKIPPDEDELLHARRLIAQRCLCGVDKNPLAVDLAKLSLWLATLAKDHAFTFLDHAIKHGDSLVGLSKKQIAAFHWKPEAQGTFAEALVEDQVKKVAELRRAIQLAEDEAQNAELTALLGQADKALADVRLIGDLAIAAFFGAEKDRQRLALRDEYLGLLTAYLDLKAPALRPIEPIAALRSGERPLPPFHWEVEFPEVFERDNPGFDAIVGNPPFAGKNTMGDSFDPAYGDWLAELHRGSHGNADLVAHFFRRAFALLRVGGALGLIATITIRQGDTRSTGLRWICENDGAIYNAVRRIKWPGQAAVTVCTVNVAKHFSPRPIFLDNKLCEVITAYLFHQGTSSDPAPLQSNKGICFQGPIVLGMGFTFDDSDTKATNLSEMERLVNSHPNNKERIFPYLGGDEMLSDPRHLHRRYVIAFDEMSETQARQWPDLMSIIEAKVKPERLQLKDNSDGKRRKKFWWQWGRYTPALFHAIEGLETVFMHPFTSTYLAFARVPASTVIAGPHYALASKHMSLFSTIQSRPHELWAFFFSSSREDRD